MLTQERKVVELLRLLGGDASESVLSRLRPERASLLRKKLAESAEPLSSHKQAQILDEFDCVFSLFKPGAGGPRLHQPDDEDDRPAAKPRPAPSKPFHPSGDPLHDLERINVHQVASALESEQPRTVAALLAELSPERTAEVLSLFPETSRHAVVRELSGATRAHHLLIQRMAQSMLSRAMTMPSQPPDRSDRVQRLASVLRAVDKPLRKKMFESIREQDSETAEGLLEKMYVFEDIDKLKDRQVQKLLTEVDSKMVSAALFGADATINDKVMSNLSRRAREALQEEMQFQTEVPPEEVQAARTQVARAIARMDQEA
jgi:flagellar motor switch protein FliG